MINKIIKLTLISLLSFKIYANEFVVKLNDKHYVDNVNVEDYLKQSSLNCISPLIENETKDECVNPIELVNWIYTEGDNCNGMRQSNFDPNLYFARSRSNSVYLDLEIPEGYHWVGESEYATLFAESTVVTKNNSIMTYYNHCGLTGTPLSETGENQFIFLFSDSGNKGMYMANNEHHGVTHTSYTLNNDFAGYVLYKD